MKPELFEDTPEVKKEKFNELCAQWVKELELHKNPFDEVAVTERWSEFPKHMTVGVFIDRLKNPDKYGPAEYTRWRLVK